MSDNSTQGGSDVIRDLDKQGGNGPKTQVFVVDKGGAGVESLVSDTNPMPVLDEQSVNLLRILANLLMSPQAFDSALNRYRETCVIESGTLTTLTTCGTVTSITNPVGVGNVATIDGRNGAMLVNAMDHTAWALNVRARIT